MNKTDNTALNNGVESKELNSNYGESAINKSKELEWDRTVEVKSMNIVFQICDLLETSVDLRQQHNDTMIDFTEGIIKDLLTQQRTELLEEIEKLKMIVDTSDWEEHERGIPKGYNKCLKDIADLINKK